MFNMCVTFLSAHAGVSVDAIQPGLVGLQPPLEELMDTLDVLPGKLMND